MQVPQIFREIRPSEELPLIENYAQRVAERFENEAQLLPNRVDLQSLLSLSGRLHRDCMEQAGSDLNSMIFDSGGGVFRITKAIDRRVKDTLLIKTLQFFVRQSLQESKNSSRMKIVNENLGSDFGLFVEAGGSGPPTSARSFLTA
jgi:hypothetical protein